MSIRTGVCVSTLACVLAVGARVSTVQADYTTVADWQFNSEADLLVDSSGNGHTLTKNGTVTFNSGNAAFGGTGMLSTATNVDLTPYSKVRVSWSLNAAGVSSVQAVWGHSPIVFAADHDGAIGSFIDNAGGAGTSEAVLNTWNTNGSHNVDTFPLAAATWQNMTAEYDLTASNVANVVKVYQDGTLVGSASSLQGGAPASFLSDKFFIGAQGGSVGFIGEIGYLKIEGQPIPEPSAIVLVTTGLIGVLCYAWRKQK